MKIGDEVKITFQDHAQDSNNLLLFNVYGIISAVTKSSVTINSWDAEGMISEEPNYNTTMYTLVRNAIVNVKYLK